MPLDTIPISRAHNAIILNDDTNGVQHVRFISLIT
uniref:Uncharacterized protein n=1 Tax=Arundo donax TaxID=35708 RepID=A0A0A9CHJ8_ARUDO